ncbi:hypothetical protein B0T24DRAFT_628193 [Lasiosphaeria ovina]|uniref:Uncharacterized protein n=1 Tax=Lasiosphaeria ovina TaxID=92902 RepID=A0AAE0K7E7_9PEZI|nr:hypothetical protein B0T24DRAFT_628193 [Lasiosphaeria ovina]
MSSSLPEEDHLVRPSSPSFTVGLIDPSTDVCLIARLALRELKNKLEQPENGLGQSQKDLGRRESDLTVQSEDFNLQLAQLTSTIRIPPISPAASRPNSPQTVEHIPYSLPLNKKRRRRQKVGRAPSQAKKALSGEKIVDLTVNNIIIALRAIIGGKVDTDAVNQFLVSCLHYTAWKPHTRMTKIWGSERAGKSETRDVKSAGVALNITNIVCHLLPPLGKGKALILFTAIAVGRCKFRSLLEFPDNRWGIVTSAAKKLAVELEKEDIPNNWLAINPAVFAARKYSIDYDEACRYLDLLNFIPLRSIPELPLLFPISDVPRTWSTESPSAPSWLEFPNEVNNAQLYASGITTQQEPNDPDTRLQIIQPNSRSTISQYIAPITSGKAVGNHRLHLKSDGYITVIWSGGITRLSLGNSTEPAEMGYGCDDPDVRLISPVERRITAVVADVSKLETALGDMLYRGFQTSSTRKKEIGSALTQGARMFMAVREYDDFMLEIQIGLEAGRMIAQLIPTGSNLCEVFGDYLYSIMESSKTKPPLRLTINEEYKLELALGYIKGLEVACSIFPCL